jgi:hypothetical protein
MADVDMTAAATAAHSNFSFIAIPLVMPCGTVAPAI